MAESPSGHQFIVKRSPDREERYKIVQTRVHDRIHALEDVTEQWSEYKSQENVVLNVVEETKAMVGETKSYGVELENIKADFGRINVCLSTWFLFIWKKIEIQIPHINYYVVLLEDINL